MRHDQDDQGLRRAPSDAARTAKRHQRGQVGRLPRPQQLESTLPPELMTLPRWLPWIALPRANGGLGKAPALPRAGRLAPVDCQPEGLPWQEALTLARDHRAGGVGVVLSSSAGLVALDLDAPLSAEMNRQLTEIDGYAEYSPSGQGVHVWLRGTLPCSRRERGREWLAQGFVTVTGRSLAGRGRRLGDLAQAQGVLKADLAPGTTRIGDVQCRRLTVPDQEVLRRLRRARNGDRAMRLLSGAWETLGYVSPSEADYAAVRLLAFWTRDSDQIERLLWASGLVRTKYDQPGYLSRTITRALALGGPVYSGKGDLE